MKATHKEIVADVLAILHMPVEFLSNNDLCYCVLRLREVLDDLLYFYQDGDQTVACIENCIFYLEEMKTLPKNNHDYEVNRGVVIYELGKLL